MVELMWAAGHLVQSHMKHNRKTSKPEPEPILTQHTLPSQNLK